MLSGKYLQVTSTARDLAYLALGSRAVEEGEEGLAPAVASSTEEATTTPTTTRKRRTASFLHQSEASSSCSNISTILFSSSSSILSVATLRRDLLPMTAEATASTTIATIWKFLPKVAVAAIAGISYRSSSNNRSGSANTSSLPRSAVVVVATGEITAMPSISLLLARHRPRPTTGCLSSKVATRPLPTRRILLTSGSSSSKGCL